MSHGFYRIKHVSININLFEAYNSGSTQNDEVMTPQMYKKCILLFELC